MMDHIKDLILRGSFEDAKNKLSSLTISEIQTILFTLAFDGGNMCSYAFVCFLLQKEEVLAWHLFATKLLRILSFHWGGAYQTSLYHAQRVLCLSGDDDFAIQNACRFFEEDLRRFINDMNALSVALELQKKDPESRIIKDFLEKKCNFRL